MSLTHYIAEQKSSYRKLAKRIGRSAQTVNNIARGIKGFDIDTGLRIKRETGLSLDELAAPREKFLGIESGADETTEPPPPAEASAA